MDSKRFDLFLFRIFYATKCWEDSASSKRLGRGNSKVQSALKWGTCLVLSKEQEDPGGWSKASEGEREETSPTGRR